MWNPNPQDVNFNALPIYFIICHATPVSIEVIVYGFIQRCSLQISQTTLLFTKTTTTLSIFVGCSTLSPAVADIPEGVNHICQNMPTENTSCFSASHRLLQWYIRYWIDQTRPASCRRPSDSFATHSSNATIISAVTVECS